MGVIIAIPIATGMLSRDPEGLPPRSAERGEARLSSRWREPRAASVRWTPRTFSCGAQSAVDMISPPTISLPPGASAESLTDARATWTAMLTWTAACADGARGELVAERARDRHDLGALVGGRLAVVRQHARADDGAAGLQRQRQPRAAEALLGGVEDRRRVVEHLVALGVGAVGDPDLDVDRGGRRGRLAPRPSSFRPPRAAPPGTPWRSGSGARRVFSMQRSTTASSAGETGAAWLGRGGGASRCCRSMSVIVSARNGILSGQQVVEHDARARRRRCADRSRRRGSARAPSCTTCRAGCRRR